MEYLSEDHAKLLLTKEWLVKTDSDSSTPYLLKFYSSTIDLTCCVLITDTKNVWGEVLTSSQLARRWRDCNQLNSTSFADTDEEDAWRIECLEFLSTVHTIGGIAELSFERVKSHFSDLAFAVGTDSFRWRWETFNVGPKLSADVLSKHLILPMISMTHLAFSSTDPLATTTEAEMEKSVDKLGRTARRTLDTHVKNALSRPLLATTLRRITAMFNFVPELPRVVADSATPDLTPPSPPTASRVPPALKLPPRRTVSPPPVHGFLAESSTQNRSNGQTKPVSRIKPASQAKPASRAPSKVPLADDSVTEEEPEEVEWPTSGGKGEAIQDRRSTPPRDNSPGLSVPSKRATTDQSPPPQSPDSPKGSNLPASSSPLPPPKKMKRAQVSSSSDEEDSEDERKKRLARLKGNTARGAKQPLKRGGKRF
ncbi:hypothetical protein C8Q74DRAFT_1349161 [Fomes fomentarius]|nr:hypothetical protein C8Q74DRAFT_1349161 [Fomes fomentarius]